MKKTQKHLSVFLSIALLLSTIIFPVSTFAEDEFPHDEPIVEKSLPEDNLNAEPTDDISPVIDEPENNYNGDFLPGRVIVTLKQNSASTYGIAPFSADDTSALSAGSIFDGIDITNAELISPAEEEIGPMLMSAQSIDEPGDILLLELSDKSEQGVLSAIEQLQGNEAVLWAEPDYIRELCDTIPNDEFYGEQWGMNRINAPKAWDTFTGSSDIVVGVIDTGIDYTHPDLVDNMWVNEGEIPDNGIDDDHDGYIDDIYGWDFYENNNDPMDIGYHGTHVSGIIAAKGNNGIGVSGVAWNTKIAALNAGSNEKGVSTAAVIKAITYATFHKFDIINGSFGSYSASSAEKTAIERFPGLFVAAAGNDKKDTDINPHYPSCYDCDNIIAVANMDESGMLAYSSNYGVESTDIAAPGTDIYSTVPGGYNYVSGTSMASPCVAGAAALLKGYNPSLSAVELKDMIFSNVQTSWAYSQVSSGGRLELSNLLTPVNGTANDGIVDPGRDEWWTTSIEWNQYAGLDENEPYFQQCSFNIDSVDVICKNQTYTVPAKNFRYDVIGANYDYDANSEYELCVKVYYDGSAEYYIDPGYRQLEMGQDNKNTAYFDNYALIYVADVYSDQNGQLFSRSAKLIAPNYTWWEHSLTYDPDNNPNSKLDIDSIQICVDGNYYTVPSTTITMRPAVSSATLSQERYYSLAVRLNNDGTAEYGTYTPWFDRETKGPIYDNYGVLIPIFDFIYGPNYELTVTQVWFRDDIYYPGDGVVYPGKDVWWNSSIKWEQYMPGVGSYFQQCYFTPESINVVCKNQTYTVPSKTFRYDVIGANYDYETGRDYYLTVKVNYNGTAQYQIEDYVNENNSKSSAVLYYDTYAVVPIAKIYSDSNGQMFLKEFLNGSIYTNGQYVSSSTSPTMNSAIKVKDIASERETAVALSTDGEVYVWGDGSYYDLGQGQVKLNEYAPVKVNGLPEIVKIAKGKHHVLALDVNGEVWGWGNNSSGEIHGTYKGKVYVPTKISGLSDVTDIAAGTGFSAVIKNDGTLWTWGNDTDGKLGDRGGSAANRPAQVVGLNNVSKVTCGEKFMAALSGNTVYTWGNNTSGQLGNGTNDSTATPTAVAGSYKDIVAGNSHMLAISTSNVLYTWGYNSVGQLGLGDKVSRNVPTSTERTAEVIGAGYNHSFYTDGKNTYGFGSGSKGQLGIGNPNTTLTPTLIPGLKNVAKIDGGFDFTIARDQNNNIWVFGNNDKGQLGLYK